MTTITDSVELFLTQRGYLPNTTESYLHWVRRLESYFPDRDISSLAPEDVASFFQHLQTRRLVGAQSVRQATSAIRFMFREILRRKDLADVVPKIRLTRPQASIPTQQEILSVIEKVKNKQLQTALKCMYGMGLELQDLRSLKVKHIDFQTHKIRVQSQRSKVVRLVPIPRLVLDDLKSIAKASGPDQFIFPSKSDALLGEQMLQRAWRTGQRAANVVGNYSLRSLRHAYIRHLELLGVPLKDVLHHLGVSNGFEQFPQFPRKDRRKVFS